ncbi:MULTISPECIES: hypothetical protein [unclassified Gemella]|uniref:hypothetical protein n=1 Tax=unclassified Gemella TaxID=2624949 RepID=UPI0015D0427E|nr:MULTISPECIES: hypothetical protein [unclassified Gemella]MBF0710562.1 hypothetical protein [Gemella sp. GL1.1]MBF0746459.1 hypothetical protein [Gemella sp. 19428wG2_WT2a]NYS27906.1 hypothetical protein [Gemella sp. GL1]
MEKVEKYVNVEQYKNYLDLAIQGKEINDDKINLVDIDENNKEVIDYISGFKAIKGYLNALQIKFDFTDNPIKGGGSFYPGENSIYIKKGQSQEEAFKALLESVVHAKLHNEALENNQNYVYNQFEIESIAYMIASHYDVDTSIYTFENITRSIEEKDVYEDFESKLNEIQHEAKEIISKIDTKLAKVKAAKLNKGRPLNPVQERLQAARNKRIVASEQKTVKKQRTQEEMKR